MSDDEVLSAAEDDFPGGDGTKLSVRDRRLATDARPLIAGCGCHACRRFSRAYVHHLVDTHEMMADVLLYGHNLFHYGQFLLQVRTAVREGRFAEYAAWFRAANRIPATSD